MGKQQIHRVGLGPLIRHGGAESHPAWLKAPGAALGVRLALAIWALAGYGCANVRITDPARTATEQFLLSQAAVKAVELLSFEALHGREVFLDVAYFAPAEREFVLGEFRTGLLHAGISIAAKREDAHIIVEVRSGGVGIDRYESLFGIPALTAPSGATSTAAGVPMASLITPELALTKKIRQVAFASVGYVAYWADTGEVVASSGPAIGKTYREDWWLFGFGPRTIGTIAPVDHEFN